MNPLTFAITIGAYKLFDFVELNICRSRVIFGDDVAILIDDDRSENSDKIREIAEKYDCSYVCSEMQRGHFAGDLQTFVNSMVFCKSAKADVGLKISQRVIPVLPAFRECVEKAFENPQIQIALPGKINPRHIARPMARFYGQFGILTDVMAIRRDAMPPQELVDVYRKRFTGSPNHADSLIETTWGWILANRFPNAHVIIPEWTNHEPFKPKIYLRKSQALEREYAQIASMHGIEGTWNLAEWGMIERKNYLCRPLCV